MSNAGTQLAHEMRPRTYFERSELTRKFIVDNPFVSQEIAAEEHDRALEENSTTDE